MIRGRDFLPVIDFLASLDGEASLRTQIGRLYYATFLEVRRWCEAELGYSRVRMAREHQAIANLFASIDPPVADNLKALRIARNAADYDENLSSTEITELHEIAIEVSRTILKRLPN